MICRKARKIGGNPGGSAQKPLHCRMGSQLWILWVWVWQANPSKLWLLDMWLGAFCSQFIKIQSLRPSFEVRTVFLDQNPLLELEASLIFFTFGLLWQWRQNSRTALHLVPCAVCHPGTAEDLRRHPWSVSWPFTSFCLFVMHLDRELQGWWHCVGIECFGWPQSSKVLWCSKTFDLAHSADCWFLWCLLSPFSPAEPLKRTES